MNLEEYKSQAAQRYPNTAFVEETLQNLKNNRAKLRIPVKKVGKAVGEISLLTAAAFAVLVGVGTIRGTLSEVSITEQNPEEEQAILADREALYMTPLSNPDHTVRINTENGKVTMNENTTVEEMFACGAVIDDDSGFVGYEQICNFLRAYRNGEAAELVIAEVPTEYRPDRRGYQYIGLNADGTVNGMYYEHTGELLTTYPFERSGRVQNGGIQFGYCAATSTTEDKGKRVASRSTVAGMALDLSSYGRGGSFNIQARNFIPICTISDLLQVSERDGDTVRENYFYVLSHLGEKEGVNILWNGQYSTPAQLELFLKRAEADSVSYCSTTITDLTKTDEYEECFYALEYLNGTYRIFTMKNGFEGEFHTELFDGYTVEDGMLIFRNGSAEYRFPYVKGALDDLFESVSPEEKRFIGNDAEVFRSYYSLMNGKNWRLWWDESSRWHAEVYSNQGGFVVYPVDNMIFVDIATDDAEPLKTRFEPLCADPNDVAEFVDDPRNLMKISEEYSEGDLLAAEIDVLPAGYGFNNFGNRYADLTLALPENTGKIKVAENTALWIPSELCDIREMPDGKNYLMISEQKWKETTCYGTTLDAKNQRFRFNVNCWS